MNPNQQPQDTDSNSVTTNPPQFGAPEQQPVATPADFSAAPSVADADTAPQPEDTQATSTPDPQPAPFGQPTSPSPEASAATTPPVGVPTAAQPPAVHGENPGQVLGIISIVLSFVGLSIIGIILGVISRKKSKEANAPTTLGTVGLVIGIVTTVLAILSFVLIFGLAMLSASLGETTTTDDSDTSSLFTE